MAAIHLKLNILTYFLIGYKQVGCKCNERPNKKQTDSIRQENTETKIGQTTSRHALPTQSFLFFSYRTFF